MNAKVRSSQLNLRLPPSLKAAAEKAAERDHRSVTSLIEKLLADHLQGRASLDTWHSRAQARFDDLLLQRAPSLAGPRKYRALSFSIHTTDGQELQPQNLLQIVHALPNGMRGIFTIPSLFHAFPQIEFAPYYTSDSTGSRGDDTDEILESAVFPGEARLDTADFWRITPKGFASHICKYHEDQEHMRKVGEPGKWFWPYSLIRDLHELVLHAYLLSERFEKAEFVEFRCEWWGLRDRELADPQPGIHWLPGKIAKMDHRVTTGEWAKEDLRRTPDVVSALAAPVLRLFDPTFDCSPEWAGAQTQRFCS